MRRIIGLVLMGLAGFLITTALLAVFYVPGAVKKTPLDTDTYTRLTGSASALPSGEGAPVKALSHTVADGQKSDGDVVVFDTFTCLIKDPNGDAPDCVDGNMVSCRGWPDMPEWSRAFMNVLERAAVPA